MNDRGRITSPAAKRLAWAVLAGLFAAPSFAAKSTWQGANGGDWSDPANWLGPVPQNAGDVAVFGPTDNAGVMIVSPVTIGSIQDASPGVSLGNSYGAPNSLLTFRDPSGNSSIALTGTGTLTFHTPLYLQSNLTITAPQNGGSWVPAQVVMGEGPGSFYDSIRGSGTLTVARGSVLFSNGPSFTGDVVVSGGFLQFNGTPGSASVVGPNASIFVLDGSVQSLKLVNATGSLTMPAVWAAGNGRESVAGPIDLGTVGSTLGGGFTANGPITGGSLTLTGRLTVAAPSTYTGPTVIGTDLFPAFMQLTGQGSLANTPSIAVGPGSSLSFSEDSAGVFSRVGTIPISLRGGSGLGGIEVNNAASSGAVTEHIGPVTLVSGANYFGAGPGTEPYSTTTRLLIDSLARNPGTLAGFSGDAGNTGTHVFFANPPPLTNGIIGGWARASDFATYDPVAGVQVLPSAGRPAHVNGASFSDNVRATTSEMLTADTIINSLDFIGKFNQTLNLDLGGHALTILSGGLFANGRPAPVINHGTLTAGLEPDGNAELFLYGSGEINASIVDNGQGPVSLVATGGILSGNNHYSGPTFVNGGLQVTNPAAIPPNNALVIQGGSYTMKFAQPTNVLFQKVTLGANGQIWGNGTVNAPLDLQSGMILANLAGSHYNLKETDGLVTLSGDNAALSGTINVQNGLLSAQSPTALGQTTTLVQPGARVVIATPNVGTMQNGPVIQLVGGELAASYPIVGSTPPSFGGIVVVGADSSLLTYDGLATYSNWNQASETAPNLSLTGWLSMRPGVTLHVTGSQPVSVHGSVFSGAGSLIDALPGVMTIEPAAGNKVWGTGDINSETSFHDGGILLPGYPGVGTLRVRTADWGSGGVYQWKLLDAGPAAGTGSDLLQVDQNLSISGTAAQPFVVNVNSVDGQGNPAAAGHFDGRQTYSWVITTAAQVSGFNAGSIIANDRTFDQQNPGATGMFHVYAAGGDVFLRYSGSDPTLIGDANHDGHVDLLDLELIASHYGAGEATYDMGDFNLDGSVGYDDLLVLARDYGTPPTDAQIQMFTPQFQSDVRNAFAAVPEPTALLAIVVPSLALIRRRRN